MFVSHNLDAIERLCSRVAWLERGRLVALGPAQEVVNAYLTAELEDVPERVFAPDGAAAQFRAARVTGPDGAPAARLRRDEPVTVEVRFALLEAVPTIDMTMLVSSAKGTRVLDEAWSETAPDERGQPGRVRGADRHPARAERRGVRGLLLAGFGLRGLRLPRRRAALPAGGCDQGPARAGRAAGAGLGRAPQRGDGTRAAAAPGS